MDSYGIIILCQLQHFFLIINVAFPTAYSKPPHTTLKLFMNDSGNITSRDFPFSCCLEQRLTLVFISSNASRGYIHLNFTDLDLPPQAIFQIYLSKTESPDQLYSSQPVYTSGSWKRPYVSSGSSPAIIHLVIRMADIPSNRTNYAGYKAVYEVTTDPKPQMNVTTELCRPVFDAWEGTTIRIKPQPISPYIDKWLDCLWIIHVPPAAQQKLYVYVRFDEFDLKSGGVLELRRGTTSLSSTIIRASNLSSVYQSSEGYVSHTGLYVRALLPADDRGSRLQFVYGVMYRVADESQCPEDSFKCPSVHWWCLPSKHICNHANNCPNGEDEQNCDVTMDTTDEAKSGVTSTKCTEGEIYCEDGDYCVAESTKTCRGECQSYEKRCANGDCVSRYSLCAEDPCPIHLALRCEDQLQCYTELDRCDNYHDCDDGSDESNCSGFTKDNQMLSMLIALPAGVVVFGICCVILCYKCCNGCKKYAAANNEALSDVGMSQGLSLHRIPPRRLLRPNRNNPDSRHSYQGVATADVSPCPSENNEAPPSSVIPEPPPSYEEVTTTNNYPIRQRPQETPPPAYDSLMVEV